jgi:outer membrane protein assembly factor BamB
MGQGNRRGEGRARRWAALAALSTLALLAAVLVGGCGGSGLSSSSSDATIAAGGTGYSGGDLANTRAVDAKIDRANVGSLKLAWKVPLSGAGTYGSYASTPVVVHGIAYSQDLASNVQAIDIESGEVLWTHKYESPSHGPNGLAVAEGRVYGATATEAFALDQETGEQIWAVGLTVNPHEGIDMAPGVNDGRVYVSTVPVTATEDYGGGANGVLWALDAKTGKKAWHFDTAAADLWSKKNRNVNSGGGLWYPPSFDGKGAVYFGTGNPGPLPGTEKFPWGSSRPGPNLYSDSLVKLDPKTGKVDWFHQVTPHNVYDWDFQDSPILTEIKGEPVAIGAGKSGIVIAFDAETGKAIWSTPVGRHNGHDRDSTYAMRGEYSKIDVPAEVFPGEIGGVLAPMAASKSMVYVPVINHSMNVVSGSEVSEESAATGELAALDLATGKVAWKKTFPGPVYGAATLVNDLVFTTTAEGTIHALDAKTGGEIWQAALPAGTNAGVTVSGDMLIAGAGLPVAEGQVPTVVGFRLDGE